MEFLLSAWERGWYPCKEVWFLLVQELFAPQTKERTL